MFSGGKDSACIVHLAARLFGADRIPFTLVHFDSGGNFPEVLEYRDRIARELGAALVSARVRDEDRDTHGSIPALISLINATQREYGFDVLIGGGRRDEERARAKERIFSLRDAEGRWNPREQRPEPWQAFNTELKEGEHLRVFPLSDWTERNVWEYLAHARVDLPRLYFAHEREVVLRDGSWRAYVAGAELRPGERPEVRSVRCRTVGDIDTTGFILSDARDAQAVLDEVRASRLSERAARAEDADTATGMEARKRAGWP
jgi:sulfate adenylyltransferase subunit 2